MEKRTKRILLLVSVSISILFVVLWLMMRSHRTSGHRSLAATVALKSLEQSCEIFLEEYQRLPLPDGSGTDGERITTGKDLNIMPILCNPTPVTESSKHLNFFEYRKARNKKDGLLRNEEGTYAELFDPWGNPYHLLLDYNSDGRLKDPESGKLISGRRVLVWSKGPDGKSGTPETNKDNLYSWERQ